MLSIINILIVFFIILIIYQLLLANYVVEGLKSCASDPGYLCKKLAKANVIKNITDISNNVYALQGQVNELIQANKDYTSNMVGTTPPQITGT